MYGFEAPPQPQDWLTYLGAAVYLGLLLTTFRRLWPQGRLPRAGLISIVCAWFGSSSIGVLAYISHYFVHGEPAELLRLSLLSSILLLVTIGVAKVGKAGAKIITGTAKLRR